MQRKKSEPKQPKKTKSSLLEEANIKFAESAETPVPVETEEAKVEKSNDDVLAESGLQIALPPSQAVIIMGLRSNGVPFFEIMGKNANLITVSGIMEMAKRNLDNLWANRFKA